MDSTIPLTIIGAGAVGSWTALALAKAGCRKIMLYDGDQVAAANVSAQLYGPGDVGLPKASAIAAHLARLTDATVFATSRDWRNDPLRGLVIAATDTMVSRQAIYTAVRDRPIVVALCDVRLGHTARHQPVGVQYTIDPASILDQEFYESTLHTDATAEQAGCTTLTTPALAMLAASLVTSQVQRILAGEPWQRQIAFGTDLRTAF